MKRWEDRGVEKNTSKTNDFQSNITRFAVKPAHLKENITQMGSFSPGRVNIKRYVQLPLFQKIIPEHFHWFDLWRDEGFLFLLCLGPVTQSQFSTVGSMLEISQVKAFTSYMRWHPTTISLNYPKSHGRYEHSPFDNQGKTLHSKGSSVFFACFRFFIGWGWGSGEWKRVATKIHPHLSPLTLHFVLLLAKWETTSAKAKRGCTGVTALQSQIPQIYNRFAVFDPPKRGWFNDSMILVLTKQERVPSFQPVVLWPLRRVPSWILHGSHLLTCHIFG